MGMGLSKSWGWSTGIWGSEDPHQSKILYIGILIRVLPSAQGDGLFEGKMGGLMQQQQAELREALVRLCSEKVGQELIRLQSCQWKITAWDCVCGERIGVKNMTRNSMCVGE